MGIEAATTVAADARERALARYAAAELAQEIPALHPASSDASFRRYFRFERAGGGTLIAMDAPPGREDLRRFVRIARALRAHDLHVPEVYAADFEQGFALLEDLGSRTYLARLGEGADPGPLYGAAIAALVRLQAAPALAFPDYSAKLFDRETDLFADWLLERHLGLALSAGERGLLAGVRRRLTALGLAQPRVPVHRDYHSRNLMDCAPLPGILDFQDAVTGPVTYDLVSLLKDCYVRWPRERVRAWLREWRRAALGAGVPAGRDEAELVDWFETMGMQRHLKAAGIFARLRHRDGKSAYLAAVPRTLGYVHEAAGGRADFADFADFLAARVLPRLGPDADAS